MGFGHVCVSAREKVKIADDDDDDDDDPATVDALLNRDSSPPRMPLREFMFY